MRARDGLILLLVLFSASSFAGEPDERAPELKDVSIKPSFRASQESAAAKTADSGNDRLAWNLADLKVDKAWSLSKGRTRVCLVDTGLDSSNAKLRARVQGGYNLLAQSADFSDSDGQGTAVAGVVVSVAPEARLYAAKVAESSAGGVSPDLISSGILWCLEQGAALINVSVAMNSAAGDGTPAADAVKLARAKGALVITTSRPENALAGNPDVVTVSASDFWGRPADGAQSASFSAPGAAIVVTRPGGGAAARSGTAYAAPHITGLAALYSAANAGAGPDDIRSALTRAITRSWIPEDEQREGKIDAARLLRNR